MLMHAQHFQRGVHGVIICLLRAGTVPDLEGRISWENFSTAVTAVRARLAISRALVRAGANASDAFKTTFNTMATSEQMRCRILKR
jgi:hypothetical protein